MARRGGRRLHRHGAPALGQGGGCGRQENRRRLTRAAILALALSTACARPTAPQAVRVFDRAPDLAIVTWNIHNDAGNVAALLRDLRSGTLTGGRPAREVVLLLQEASPRVRVEGLHWFFAAARRIDGVERGNAILSSLPLTAAHGVELPRERQRRVAAVATVRIAGRDLTLVNVHLENRASWWKGVLPGDRARERQMKALLAQVPDGPGILGGDLNIWLGTAEGAYKAAAASFPDVRDTPQPAFTFRDRLALDHLFFRLPAGWRASWAKRPQRYGSDHHPVVGVLLTD